MKNQLLTRYFSDGQVTTATTEPKGRKLFQIARLQSPSSINTFKQCPRKYYYQYIEKLKTSNSIHLVRGRAVHSVLEDFFQFDISAISEAGFEYELRIILFDLFKKHWIKVMPELKSLDMPQTELLFYHNESKMMLNNWYERLIAELKMEMQSHNLSFKQAFEKLTPRCEAQYKSTDWGVRGYVDAILEFDNEIQIVDYKTSKKAHISDAYRLQLAIYALLYWETHNKLPTKVGIDFLKHDKQFLDVDEELLELAREELQFIHENTHSKDMYDYPKKITPLCKWHSGQCDFYNTCSKAN